MTRFNSPEEKKIVAAYRQARRQGHSYETAFDDALTAYCAGFNRPQSVRAEVDVGVMIAQGQRKYGRWMEGLDI